ncbi:TfoX/Sxy family protein, partial [Listeria monocytogenes]
ELCALEGAVQGIRRHDLDEAKKSELKKLHQSLQKKPRSIYA